MRQTTGIKGEALAVTYLQQQDIKILQRNFRCNHGEIDIIGYDDNLLMFTEVRYRKNNRFGSATESVNFSKQQKIINCALYYLQNYSSDVENYRFDVIAISDTLQKPKIEWIKDAFNA